MTAKLKVVAPEAMKKKQKNGDYVLNVNPQTLQPADDKKGGEK